MRTFFLLKDGPRFVPRLRRSVGMPAAPTQALVRFVDAAPIGIGVLNFGAPLASALAIVTFIGGFVPVVGAFVAGGHGRSDHPILR